MRIDEFDYELPGELIAQAPAGQRDASRLLVISHDAGIVHRRFRELPAFLEPGDLLVLNDAKVIPARIEAHRETGGRVELLFLAAASATPRHWHVLAKPARRVRVGDRLTVGNEIRLRVVGVADRGRRLVEVPDDVEVEELLQRLGSMPLPPYIHPQPGAERERLDRQRYQTVYAARPGAVAAPTAGLHFSEELLSGLSSAGIEIVPLTLHVGPGTFRPVECERVEDHDMDAERYEIPAATAAAIERARVGGRRILAVGTTAVRALEHSAATQGRVIAGGGSAELFVWPGFRFQVIDGMITNFHLPRSTPILLVAALVGRERLLEAYREAIARGYRFYSYGDAMLVLP